MYLRIVEIIESFRQEGERRWDMLSTNSRNYRVLQTLSRIGLVIGNLRIVEIIESFRLYLDIRLSALLIYE